MFMTMLLCICTQELPAPPEPEAVEAREALFSQLSVPQAEETAKISIPSRIPLYSRVQCDITGISLKDVTKSKVILRVYPKGGVEVTDGISFIKRVPYLVVYPKKAGNYTLVFIVLTEEGKLTFIESEFEVVE